MKTLILIFGCLLLVMPSSVFAEASSFAAATEDRSTDRQAAEKQQHSPTQQFEEIEKYIARLHQGVETYYANQLIEVKQRAEAEIRMLEVADKAVYAGLAEQAEVAKTVLHINNYGYRAPWYLEAKTERMLQLKDDFDKYKIRRSPEWFTMTHGSSTAETAEITAETTVNTIVGGVITGSTSSGSTSGSTSGSISGLSQSWIDYGDFEDSIKRTSKRFAVAQSKIAERKSEILAKLEFETAGLERQKNYALTVTLPELEKRLKQDLLRPQPEPTHGLVTGIVYSEDRPSAIIDRKIVHEGDVIYGVTVVKIHQDGVKFSRKSKSWEQKVQQAPESYW